MPPEPERSWFDWEGFTEDVEAYCTRQGFNYTQFAAKVGANRATISNFFNRKRRLSTDYMIAVAWTCDLDPMRYALGDYT